VLEILSAILSAIYRLIKKTNGYEINKSWFRNTFGRQMLFLKRRYSFTQFEMMLNREFAQ
jgi:hypothetical protein